MIRNAWASREDFRSPRQARRRLRGNEAFSAECVRACEERLSAWEDEIVLIADDAIPPPKGDRSVPPFPGTELRISRRRVFSWNNC